MCTWELPTWFKFILSTLFFAYPFFEWWLGRTCRVKAASTIDLIVNSVKHLFGIKPKPRLLVIGLVEESKESEMLEGREFEKDLGKYGKLFVDIKEDLTIEIGGNFNAKLALQDVAAKTQKPWLRGAINFAMGFFNTGDTVAESKPVPAPAPEAKPVADDAPAKTGSLAVSGNAIKEQSPGEVKQGESSGT